MITKLSLRNFKNFREATLHLGPLTTLVGANAAGKSNLRDAFRFLHGVARGYRLADIFGEKRGEGGELQWHGIRGGTREASFHGTSSFGLEVVVETPIKDKLKEVTYRIGVSTGGENGQVASPRIVREELEVNGYSSPIFTSHPDGEEAGSDRDHITAQIRQRSRGRDPKKPFLSDRPVLTQFMDDERVQPAVQDIARSARSAISGMRFLDLNADAMRQPSLPGQTVLGDRGENLSSVLQDLYRDENRRDALIEWINVLTPMDVVDFAFQEDLTGKILVTLVEKSGMKTSAASASNGTLRYLAIVASLFASESARFYFFEELENGIHPVRVNLLVDLMERRTRRSPNVQIVTSTHSPQLLRLLGKETREHVSFVYRLEGAPNGHIRRLMDIPDAERVVKKHDLADLHESGWMQDMVSFAEDEEVSR